MVYFRKDRMNDDHNLMRNKHISIKEVSIVHKN